MLNYIYEMNLLCKMDSLFINREGCITINDNALSAYANEIKEKLNYYNMASEVGEEINYRHAFIYGLGSLFAIHLYNNYKKSPNYFKKEFRNALINYPLLEMDAFTRVGITKEEIVNNKILKKVLADI